MRLLRAFLLCALAGSAVHSRSDGQEVYKSTDASGHVVYSDRPSSAQSQKVAVPVIPADASEAARLAKLHALEDADYAQRRREEADTQARQAAQARQDAERCSAARNRYALVKDAGRLFQVDAHGNRVFYSDEQADALRSAAKQAVDQACGK